MNVLTLLIGLMVNMEDVHHIDMYYDDNNYEIVIVMDNYSRNTLIAVYDNPDTWQKDVETIKSFKFKTEGDCKQVLPGVPCD